MNRFRYSASLAFVAAALVVLPASAQAGRAPNSSTLGKLGGRFNGSLAGPQGVFRFAPAAASAHAPVSKAGSASAPRPSGSPPPAAPGGQPAAPGTPTAQSDGRGTMDPLGHP